MFSVPALRRVLRTEPRWREIVNFPGIGGSKSVPENLLGSEALTVNFRESLKLLKKAENAPT